LLFSFFFSFFLFFFSFLFERKHHDRKHFEKNDKKKKKKKIKIKKRKMKKMKKIKIKIKKTKEEDSPSSVYDNKILVEKEKIERLIEEHKYLTKRHSFFHEKFMKEINNPNYTYNSENRIFLNEIYDQLKIVNAELDSSIEKKLLYEKNKTKHDILMSLRKNSSFI